MKRRTMAAMSLAVGALVAGAWTSEAAAQAGGPITPKTQAPSEARALSRAFAAVARALQPSVVRLDVETQKNRVAQRDRRVTPELERLFERFFGEDFEMPAPGPGRGTGSGLVLDTAGNIITNSHVVENATKVTVTFWDGREFQARVVGRDPNTDTAVVRLESPPPGLVAARLGDSGKVEVGEWVLAIGSPLGLDQSVTAGIVSGKGKVGRNVQMGAALRIREYIQTDAKINPGNSGGPLVNLEGEVIGINMMINMGPGGAYGFAIPINQARRVAETIISEGRVRHAWMGIGLGDVKDGRKYVRGNFERSQGEAGKNAPERAAWVSEVRPNTPAQKAGVHVGDIITRIDDRPIHSADDVIDYVSQQRVGQRITLAYLRDGRAGNLQVTLGEMPPRLGEEPEAPKPSSESGLSMQTLTPDMARFFGVDPATKGAVVTEVAPGSRAAKAGLRADDIILEIDRKPVGTAEEAAAALAGKKAHLLRVRRGGAARFVTIPAE